MKLSKISNLLSVHAREVKKSEPSKIHWIDEPTCMKSTKLFIGALQPLPELRSVCTKEGKQTRPETSSSSKPPPPYTESDEPRTVSLAQNNKNPPFRHEDGTLREPTLEEMTKHSAVTFFHSLHLYDRNEKIDGTYLMRSETSLLCHIAVRCSLLH